MNEFNTNRTSSKSNYTLHCSPFPKSEVVSRSHGEAGVRRIMKTKQVEFTGIKLSWQTNSWVAFLIRMPNRDRSFSPHSIAALPLTYTFDFYEKLIAHFFATFSSRDNLSKYQRIRKHPSARCLIKFEFHSLGQLFTRFHPMHRPDNGHPTNAGWAVWLTHIAIVSILSSCDRCRPHEANKMLASCARTSCAHHPEIYVPSQDTQTY